MHTVTLNCVGYSATNNKLCTMKKKGKRLTKNFKCDYQQFIPERLLCTSKYTRITKELCPPVSFIVKECIVQNVNASNNYISNAFLKKGKSFYL